MEQLSPTEVASNISDGPPPLVSWDSSNLVPAVVLSLCFLLGVPGNIAVIILRPNWQNLSSLTQTLMMNLTVSDLLCLLTLPLWVYTLLYSWTFGLPACKLLAYLVYCSLYGSLLTATMLSVQRYLQVVYLQRRLAQTGKTKLMALFWVIVMILSTPMLVVRELATYGHWTHCKSNFFSRTQTIAMQLTEIIIGFICLSVVAFAYICLYRKVNQAALFDNPQMTRVLISITGTFFILWMPYHIINVISVTAIFLKNNDIGRAVLINKQMHLIPIHMHKRLHSHKRKAQPSEATWASCF
uniref:G-protein coupled receptors family 1 profile domain-containing protein n=1 Tax=Monopterus albus TaxID=43700 RepID=A0A3Q3JXD1_MONAL